MIAKLLKRQKELLKIQEKAASMIGDDNWIIDKLAMEILTTANEEYVELIDLIDKLQGKK